MDSRFNLGRVLLSLSFGWVCACAPAHPPVPPGTVPEAKEVSTVDEQYGHQVLSELSRDYPLSHDDAKINRVRDIVDKLTIPINPAQIPWHVYVLESKDFKNAAATRGNYIFVWTGLLDSLRDDGELATILAHEISHAIAGHTDPNPNAEAAQILGEVAGNAASSVIVYQGLPGIVGDLAGILLQMGIEALAVNPAQRDTELEADHIGMFLMARAGFDPEFATKFWERARTDPDFESGALNFLSSHPDSDERYEKLLSYLPQAKEVYEQMKAGGKPRLSDTKGKRDAPGHSSFDRSNGFALPGSPSSRKDTPK